MVVSRLFSTPGSALQTHRVCKVVDLFDACLAKTATPSKPKRRQRMEISVPPWPVRIPDPSSRCSRMQPKNN